MLQFPRKHQSPACPGGLAVPHNDFVAAPGDPLYREKTVYLNAHAIPLEVVQHVQQPDGAAVRQAIGLELHRPDHIPVFRARPERPARPASAVCAA